eukprot:m.34561 g.34561  ORF g.34561 m.34561 type:complete len:89 (-) comp43591_c0_seq9:195-461(-)
MSTSRPRRPGTSSTMPNAILVPYKFAISTAFILIVLNREAIDRLCLDYSIVYELPMSELSQPSPQPSQVCAVLKPSVVEASCFPSKEN